MKKIILNFSGTNSMTFSNSFFSIAPVYLRKIEYRLRRVISIKPVSRKRGRALLSYVAHPFTITKEELDRSPHTNPRECLTIAEILLERGFIVDVIDWTDTKFKPKKKYDIIIDIHQNLERLAPCLPKTCIKIFYSTGAHWRYHNAAELKRLEELRQRRGCALKPRRNISPANNIEYADYITSLGNSFAKDTYAYAKKSITQIPLLSTVAFPSPEFKNFKGVRKNFVWIGGGGAVHKGLDLVLEYFSQMPDYRLTVCGPIASETDFVDCYRKELYETPNIAVTGRIDVHSEGFKKIVGNAVGLVYPSCSEGQSGSVITGLHAGLIPIVTRESGVDVEPFGITLGSASIDEIAEAVKNISHFSETEMRSHAIASWQYAQTHHSQEIFKNAYASFIDKILKEKKL
jgi:hypothetical protein